MSYRLTRARKEFETQVDAIVREIRPLYTHGLATGTGVGSRLLAAHYVLAFAQLEVYIKSLVEDSLSAFTSANPPFDRWPDTMMAYLLHKGGNLGGDYRRFEIGDDEGAILAKLANVARRIASWGGSGSLPTAIKASEFLDKKKYPSPANLPQLFRRLGVPHIWAIVSRAGKMNSEMILTSLNDLRTGIAHEGRVPTGFGLVDFLDRIKQMRRFVAAVDRGVSTHFCPAVMPRATWNSAMM
jgi:hypothetical protein